MFYLDYFLDLEPQSVWNTVTATASAKSDLIYAQEIGNFYAGPRYFTTREGFPSYLLKLSISGAGILEYNGQKYSVPPGHFFWIDCTKRQHYYTDPDAGFWNVQWVHFKGANTKAYYEAFLSCNNGSPVSTRPLHLPIQELLNALLEADCSGENQMLTDYYLSGILTQLASQAVLATASSHRSGDVPEIIQAIRSLLQTHYQEKVTLTDLGNRFNMNPYYLQKQFKRYIGQSPTEYQIFLRMSKAKELLRSTTLSVGEIAYQVGIENLGYFTRQFKQQEGMTPQEYRHLWPGPEVK